jgi:hypothetical protein
MAKQREQGVVNNVGSMIGPGLFSGIVASSTTAASSMTNEHSSSGMSTASDCDGTVRSRSMIPAQVLVPRSMMPSWSSEPVDGGREGGCIVPEGRVHGGGLLSLLGGSFKNANVEKL